MAKIRLQQLFQQYQQAFMGYDLVEVANCYHLPCTLNTPDKVVLLTTPQECQQEFSEIFAQLQQMETSDIIAKKAVYSKVSEQVYLVCIDWDFIDGQGQVFADFAAIYHVLDTKDSMRIINVISHDLDSSLTLPESLSW